MMRFFLFFLTCITVSAYGAEPGKTVSSILRETVVALPPEIQEI